MRVFRMFLQSVLVAGPLSHWIFLAAGSEQIIEVEEELSEAAKIYASIADATCENDATKFSNFYQSVRDSIQDEGKFASYFPNKCE